MIITEIGKDIVRIVTKSGTFEVEETHNGNLRISVDTFSSNGLIVRPSAHGVVSLEQEKKVWLRG